MEMVLLTKNSTFIIGQVAWLLGVIMDGIFRVIDFIGIPNIGLAIIIFTILVNILMLPLTIRQQKFSKLQAKMQPEIQAIQEKYKGKKDNESTMAQNQEVQAVYAKYGVSASGSCVQLLIQIPILFALYQVIQKMPAYVTKLGNVFGVLAEKIIDFDAGEFLQNSGIDTIASTVTTYGRNISDTNLKNGIIDVLYKLSSTDMDTIAEYYGLSDLTYNGHLILSNASTTGLIDIYNNFLGLNLANSPTYLVKEGWAAGAYGIVIGAIMIPVLSAVTQWINVKLMPTQNNDTKSEQSGMAESMKMMNTFMPLFSAWLCFTLPCGMGVYWVTSSVVRGILQVVVNKHLDKMDYDEIIRQNSEKSSKKMAKRQEQQEKLNAYANMNTRNIQNKASMQSKATVKNGASAPDKTSLPDRSRGGSSGSTGGTAAKGSNGSGDSGKKGDAASGGSLMAKANMVKEYNERNSRESQKSGK